MSGRARCRGCGARMRWVKTEAGKNMPIDDEPNIAGNIILVGFNEAQRARKLPVAEADRLRAMPEDERPVIYMPHWKTCPERGQFKRPRGTK